ncbi:MAG: GntR family transcriptional regulator [Acidihalobacter sp.]|uniref:GntR family transcriptional regulator n=1 Tax=Acidihalobacter sp. TaxID=1872108 RepID=UPI00307F856C
MTVEIVSMGPAVTLSERLFEQIRGAIERGDIAAGSKISEPELARRFGVSRGPLREAIGRLEACGLVERRANVGARVVTLSSEGLLEIFQVREALESMAARLAAEHMTDEEIAALRGLLDQHGRQIDEDSGQAYFQKVGDLDFHYRIVQGSRNSQLIKLLCNDLYHLMRLYRYQFGMQSRRAPRAFVEHRMIVDAIEQRDGEMAELLMRHHIRTSRENVKSMLTARAS